MKSGATPPVPVCRRKRHPGTGNLLGPRFRRPLRRAQQARWTWAVAAPSGGSLVGRYGWALFWGRGREVEEALRHDAQLIEHAHHGLDP